MKDSAFCKKTLALAYICTFTFAVMMKNKIDTVKIVYQKSFRIIMVS